MTSPKTSAQEANMKHAWETIFVVVYDRRKLNSLDQKKIPVQPTTVLIMKFEHQPNKPAAVICFRT